MLFFCFFAQGSNLAQQRYVVEHSQILSRFLEYRHSYFHPTVRLYRRQLATAVGGFRISDTCFVSSRV